MFDPVSASILAGANLGLGIYKGKKEKEAKEYAKKTGKAMTAKPMKKASKRGK